MPDLPDLPPWPDVLGSLYLLGLVLLAVGGLIAVAAVVFQQRAILRPPRMTDARALRFYGRLTPGDLGLSWDAQTFHVGDISLAAWRVPLNGSPRTAVLVHGYADAKIGALAWAPLWRSLGYNLLLLDLRGHGDSGGDVTTAGWRERDDLAAVLGELKAARPGETREVAVFGVSLGAACVAAFAAGRDDLDLVVLDSPFASFVDASARHGELVGAPLPRLSRWLARRALAGHGVDEPKIRPTHTIRRIVAPLVVVASEQDVYADADDLGELEAATAAAGGRFERYDCRHVMALPADPARYAAAIVSATSAEESGESGKSGAAASAA